LVDISAGRAYVSRSHEVEKSSEIRFLREVTARLVGARGEEIDAAADGCLARMGEHFGVETVALGGISKSGALTSALRVWGLVPPKEASLAVNPPPGPEMATQFCREGSFVYGRLEDLDDFPQFRKHTRRMGVAAGVFWMHRDLGSHVEGISIGTSNPKVWPEDIVERLGAVGEVLYNAFYRRQAEKEAERLRRFERVVADITTKFIHVLPQQVDEEIEKSLGQICDCLDADLATFLQWNDPEKSTFKVTHEWDAGFLDGPYFRDAILSDAYPWLAARLREAKPLFISKLDDFPPEAAHERATCEKIGIQSSSWVPFVGADDVRGYIGFSTVNRVRSWRADIVPQLGLVTNIFASAMERWRAEIDLHQAYDEIRRLKDHFEAENITLREEIKSSLIDKEPIGKSHAFRTVLHQVNQVGGTDSTVLLVGETGTGKGLIARKIHEVSQRKDRPLVTVNCAALPVTLIESELFGHEKGAFTGAVDRKIGRFELADGGTIFLDEVGDLSLELQAKLLRILQEHQFERVGSSTTRSVDTRVIAATNRDLETLMAEGLFRADLYYRLGVFPIRIPPLRERRDDIPLLVWFFVAHLQTRLGKTFETIPSRVMDTLISYDWPGNVRELQNIVERAMILAPGSSLELGDILLGRREETKGVVPTPERPGTTLGEVESAHIIKVLQDCGWRIRGKEGAAERLGLNRSTLQSRMKKLGIRKPGLF
jgi:formate hydrogenlyase transcriptional activator